MRYVYACDHPEHERLETEHSMTANPDIYCPDCDQLMHRVPQLFTWGHNPGQVLLDKLSERHRIMKERRRLEKKYGRPSRR